MTSHNMYHGDPKVLYGSFCVFHPASQGLNPERTVYVLFKSLNVSIFGIDLWN